MPSCDLSTTSRLRTFRRWLIAGASALLLCLGWVSSAQAEKIHVVYAGQRLGSIAKRYNVSIEAICKANDISRRDPIHPGQRLIIPDRDSGRPGEPGRSGDEGRDAQEGDERKKTKKAYGSPRIHVVGKGHTLGAIGRRYGVSVAAICHATGITKTTVLRPGQKLIIPAKTDPEGKHARDLRRSGKLRDSGSSKRDEKPWEKYEKPPWRRGYIEIHAYSRSFKGYVIGPKNEVISGARQRISKVLGARTGGPVIDSRLIRLLAQVSDTFGGRPIRIVSGYRETSYVHDSKHKKGRALDFSIPGVPNEALRDYCRTLGNVGVGYYPNSTFVHLDVRGESAYWVDYAGPGEPPRLRNAKVENSRKSKKSEDAADDDEGSAARAEKRPESDSSRDEKKAHNDSSPAPAEKTPSEKAPEGEDAPAKAKTSEKSRAAKKRSEQQRASKEPSEKRPTTKGPADTSTKKAAAKN